MSDVFESLDWEEEQEAPDLATVRTTADELQETGDHAVEELYDDAYSFHGEDLGLYNAVRELVEPDLEDISYAAEDVSEFVLQNVNRYEWTRGSDRGESGRSYTLGVYTSVLADVLTERDRQEGGETEIYVNGGGNRFDHLFTELRDVDTIHVEDMVGDLMLQHAAAYGGHADRLILEDVEGTGVASSVAALGGEVGRVVINGARGDVGKRIAAGEGEAGSVLVKDVEESTRQSARGGRLVRYSAGQGIGGSHMREDTDEGVLEEVGPGDVGVTVLYGIEGDEIGKAIGTSHRHGLVVFSGVEGDRAGRGISFRGDGSPEKVLYDDLEGRLSFAVSVGGVQRGDTEEDEKICEIVDRLDGAGTADAIEVMEELEEAWFRMRENPVERALRWLT